MQFRNIFLLLLTGLFLFAPEIGQAQKITTNENGDKIILYPDGSWRYFDSKLDDVSDKYAADQDDNGTSEKSLSSKPDPEQVVKNYRKELINAAERAVADEKLALRNYEDVQFDKVLIEEELEEAQRDNNSSKAEINEIKQRLKEVEEREKDALEGLEYVSMEAREAEDKTMLSDEEIYDMIYERRQPSSNSNKKTNTVADNSSRSSNKREKRVLASFDPKDDVMLYPPVRKCILAFDGVDNFSGKKRREVAKETLFTHTSDEMRPYMKGKEFITCEAYLSSLSGGYKFLTLEITIASESAKRDYGIIEKGSILNVKLMDNSNIKLFNNKTDVGILNELDNTVTYTAQYVINSGAEKELRRNEVDKIRLIWSSGYEDYEVYSLDFFIDQFNCLN